MREKVVELSDFGETLGSRDTGEVVRRLLLEKIEQSDQPIEISFEHIFSISSSFADECFGKLVSSLGIEQFKECFVISNLHSTVLKNILNLSVKKRIDKQLQEG